MFPGELRICPRRQVPPAGQVRKTGRAERVLGNCRQTEELQRQAFFGALAMPLFDPLSFRYTMYRGPNRAVSLGKNANNRETYTVSYT